MAQFYGTKMDIDEKCASFGTRLEQKLKQVSLQYPDKISETVYWSCVRERFFHGLSKDMRTNLRTQFDSGATYYQMLELARIVESENFHENSGILAIKERARLMLLQWIIPHSKYNKCSSCKVLSRD